MFIFWPEVCQSHFYRFRLRSAPDLKFWNPSHFFRLRLRSCSKIFKSGSGNFSNLRIRLLFRLRLQSIQPKFTLVFVEEMTTPPPATAEIDKWLWVRFFTKFWLRIRVRKKNAESCRSRHRHCRFMATPVSGLLMVFALSSTLGLSQMQLQKSQKYHQKTPYFT